MKHKKYIRLLGIFVICIVFAFSFIVIHYYRAFFSPNISIKDAESTIIFIPTGSSFEDVVAIFEEKKLFVSSRSFVKTARHKGYCDAVKSGRYRIQNNISNNALINMLMSGNQEPVHVVFNNIRLIDDFCKKIETQVEFSADSLCSLLQDYETANKYGFTLETFQVMFLPNTYQVYWNISPAQFIERMYSEYNVFWNESRSKKAEELGLSKIEVSILASIVEGETMRKDEMSRVAGVYINRLSRGMLLQADPTVKFAWQDFELRRILFRHLEIDSPYNTYLYKGLPPGPICLPEPFTIDAVLNFEKHNYIFMCAKDDFSGYHAFATNAYEHGVNARRYQQALNRKNIR